MENLKNYCVTELNAQEQEEINGGIAFLLGIGIGIFIGSAGCVGGYYIAGMFF